MSSLAKESGFCKRRGKLNATQFLKMILFDQMSIDQPSLHEHCMSILKDHGMSVSKQGLDKRFNDNAVGFIQRLFEQYLKHLLRSQVTPSKFSDYFSSIRIMDSTEFKLPESLAADFPGFKGDGTASCTQIQFEYEILSGRIYDLSIGDARVPDFTYAASQFSTIEPRDLIIRDLGYSKLDSFKAIDECGAHFISRLHQQILIYEESGKGLVPLDYQTLLGRLKKSRGKYLDIPVYIGSAAQMPVRLVANLLKKDDITRRLSKKIYQKNSGKKKYDILSQVNVFITNVPRKVLSSNQVYGLYRVRWQIELIFKTWKSVLQINKVRKMKSTRFKCYLIGKLLWVVLSWEIYYLFNEEIRQSQNSFLSIYKCFKIIKLEALHLKDLITSRAKIKEWLMDLRELFEAYGLKETKNGGKSLLKLLNVKPVKA